MGSELYLTANDYDIVGKSMMQHAVLLTVLSRNLGHFLASIQDHKRPDMIIYYKTRGIFFLFPGIYNT